MASESKLDPHRSQKASPNTKSPHEQLSAEESLDKAFMFIETLRKSSKIAQDLISNNREMSVRVQSLEDDLKNGHNRIAFLEREVAQLRTGLAKIAFDDDGDLVHQFEQVMEEQNCLAHMFVTSEQLAHVSSPQDAVQAALEVLYNLIGAIEFGIWFRWDDQDPPIQVTPQVEADLRKLDKYMPLVERCLATGQAVLENKNTPDVPPVCVPLLLEGKCVGAVLVGTLVAHRPRLERLHHDLLMLLSLRLARTVCLTAFFNRLKDHTSLWAEVKPLFLSE